MNDRERNWRSVREAATCYDAPDHLGDGQLRLIARMLCAGVAYFNEDQAALGPLPDWASREAEAALNQMAE
jgi:hypothetical protein